MTASKATLCAGVTRGNRRVWPRRTWCSSCITRTKRWASVRQCSSTKRGLTRRTGRRSQLTQAVGTSSLASTRKSCRSAPRAWLRAGTASRTRRTRDSASAGVVIGRPPGRRERGPAGRRARARGGGTAGRAAPSGARGRRGPRRAEGAGCVASPMSSSRKTPRRPGHAGLPQCLLEVALQRLRPPPRAAHARRGLAGGGEDVPGRAPAPAPQAVAQRRRPRPADLPGEAHPEPQAGMERTRATAHPRRVGRARTCCGGLPSFRARPSELLGMTRRRRGSGRQAARLVPGGRQGVEVEALVVGHQQGGGVLQHAVARARRVERRQAAPQELALPVAAALADGHGLAAAARRPRRRPRPRPRACRPGGPVRSASRGKRTAEVTRRAGRGRAANPSAIDRAGSRPAAGRAPARARCAAGGRSRRGARGAASRRRDARPPTPRGERRGGRAPPPAGPRPRRAPRSGRRRRRRPRRPPRLRGRLRPAPAAPPRATRRCGRASPRAGSRAGGPRPRASRRGRRRTRPLARAGAPRPRRGGPGSARPASRSRSAAPGVGRPPPRSTARRSSSASWPRTGTSSTKAKRSARATSSGSAPS